MKNVHCPPHLVRPYHRSPAFLELDQPSYSPKRALIQRLVALIPV